MSHSNVKVLIVDDSAFVRKVLREILSIAPGVEVLGTARDGLDAVDKIIELAPDVITLDLMMPNLDGLGVMRALSTMNAPPRVVLVSISDSSSDAVTEALSLGAFDLVAKPTALATNRLYELADQLTEKIHAAFRARHTQPQPNFSRPKEGSASVKPARIVRDRAVRIIALGTSTGGPQALTSLLAKVPENLALPVVIALHIPEDYTASLAARLNKISPLHVVEAASGMTLRPNTAYIARGGHHLFIDETDGELVTRISKLPRRPYSPSVDLLFESVAKAVGSRVLGVVLTGMGNDGTNGARAIVAAGGLVISESETSSVVYGMPRCVKEAGLSYAEAALADMPELIMKTL